MASPDLNSSIKLADKVTRSPEPCLSPLELPKTLNEKLGFSSATLGSFPQNPVDSSVTQFFVSTGLPAESLSYIIELKNSTANFTGQKKSSVLTAAKHLLDTWLNSDLCAEALVRFSIFPCIVTQTSHFSRSLFALPDLFQLPRYYFLKHVLTECLLAAKVLAELIKRIQYAEEIKTTHLTGLIDRTFIRYFTDQEHVLPYFDTDNEFLKEEEWNSFVEFLVQAAEAVSECFILRRLLGKTFQGLTSVSQLKLAKVVFLTEAFFESSASTLLTPPEDFFSNSSWKRTLLQSLPLKSRVLHPNFYTAWTKFVFNQTKLPKSEIVKTLAEEWEQLMKSSVIDIPTILGLTTALIALAKGIKTSESDEQLDYVVKIFESVSYALGTTNTDKQACGMACGQVYADLYHPVIANGTPSEPKNPAIPKPEEPVAKQGPSLKFESKNPLFLKLTSYYYGPEAEVKSVAVPKRRLQPQNMMLDLSSYDSDDDLPGDSSDEEEAPTGKSKFEPYDLSNDTPLNDALGNLKSVTDKKMPVYFSNILEILIEGSTSSKDEAVVQVLKQIAVMRIPVLLHKKQRVDPSVAEQLARALIELDSSTVLEIPVICGLYEFGKEYPTEVFNLFGKITFDKDSYAVGHRIAILARMYEVVQLLSRQKCFSCFTEVTGRIDRLLNKIYAGFMSEYMLPMRSVWKCRSCIKIEGVPAAKKPKPIEASTATDKSEDSKKLLTWREIVDQRIAAKTHRFASKRQEVVEIEDVYSARLVPPIWASIANRLLSNTPYLIQTKEAETLSADLFTAQAFRVLGSVIMGTSGIYCPHYRILAAQAAELVNTYVDHRDAHVRRSVLSLLGLVVATAEGKHFAVAEFENAGTFEKLKAVSAKETDEDIKKLFNNIENIVAASAVVQLEQLMLQEPEFKFKI